MAKVLEEKEGKGFRVRDRRKVFREARETEIPTQLEAAESRFRRRTKREEEGEREVAEGVQESDRQQIEALEKEMNKKFREKGNIVEGEEIKENIDQELGEEEKERRKLEEVEKKAEEEFKKNTREAARLRVEAERRDAARRQRDDEAERERQEEMGRVIDEAKRENVERTSYNQSTTGKFMNLIGKGKYQRKDKKDKEEAQAKYEGKQATGQGGSPMPSVTVQAELKGKETDVMTIVMVLSAYAIWILDMSNFLGKPYKGFIFDPSILTRLNWVGVATSGIVSLFLIYDILSSVNKRDSITYLISMGALFIINSAYVLNIYNQAFNNIWINLIMLLLIAAIIIFYVHKRGFVALHSSEQFTYWIMVLTYSFFWTMWNWTSNLKAVIHMFFISFFMLFYLKGKEGVNPNMIYIFTSLFIFADFFGYSWDLSFPQVLTFKISFPIIVLLTSYYCGFFAKSTFGKINAFAWTVILIFLFMAGPQYAEAVGVTPTERTSGGFYNELLDPIAKAWEAFNLKITGRLDVATGGLYSSQVEKNQFEPLGVFLDKVRASQPRFYVDEPVTIWSSIKSRTLSDPVSINFNCIRYGKDNKRIGIKDDKGVRQPSEGDVIPRTPFTVYTLEEKDVECTFNQDAKNPKFQTGTNPVTISAQYNFVTSAYQEVRFIDRKRYQAMIKENLDPLKEFGITNKNPNTVYTNGPVDIKIETQNPVTVDLESEVLPNLVIVLKNRDKITDKQGKPVGQWQGKILNIEELAIIVPKGVKIFGGNCQPARFISYTKPMCIESCKKTCRDTCEEGSGKAKCLADCDSTDPKSVISRKCEDECTVLFKDEEGFTDYEGYQLDTQFIKSIPQEKRKSVFEDIGRYTQFGCRLTLNRDILEEGVSVTRKYIRVRTKYNYLLESTHSISIEQIPTIDSLKEIESVLGASRETLKFEEGIEIPLNTLKGLISVESGGKHCCKQNVIGARGCESDPYTTSCTDKILKSNRNSIGIMQINNRADMQSRNTQLVEKLRKDGLCKPNEVIYDRNCNLWMGIEILKKNYKDYGKNGRNPDKLKDTCKPGTKFYNTKLGKEVDLYELYKNYRGIEAALRAYNGWGCNVDDFRASCVNSCSSDKDVPRCIQRCVEYTVFYVDKVIESAKCIAEDPKKCPDPAPDLLQKSEGSEDYPEGV